MPLNQMLINEINTPVIGASAPPVVGFGTPGIAAVAVTNDVTGDSFFDPSAPLSLTPETEGGMGSYGQNGETFGQAGSPVTTEPSPTLTVVSWFAGTNGGAGGAGGAGAASSLNIANDAIGSVASPYGGSVLLEADAQGGDGWSGGQGGVGGGAGLAEQVGSPATKLFEGSAGGNAGAAAPGGQGGGATLTVTGVTEIGLAGTHLLLEANGGNGGTGGYGAEGGDGDSAGATSAGAAGGAGGSATVQFADNDISDQSTLSLQLFADGGSGGNGGGGGGGGPSGFGENAGLHGTANPYTATITYSQSSSGGAGGSSGLPPVLVVSGNTITAPSAFVVFGADAGYGGAGGAGGDPVTSGQDIDGSGDITNIFGSPAGATGTDGASVLGQITITDNTIATANSLELYIQIQDAGGTAQPLSGGAGGNLVFASNTLIGGGAATLNLIDVGPGATIDDLTGVLSVNGSAANSLSGFSVFDLASDDTFVAPSGTIVTTSVTIVVAPDPDTIVLSPGHASIDLDGATTTNTLLQFRGYGSALDSLGQLSADTTQGSDGTTIEVPGDGAVILPADWTPGSSDAQFTAACYAAGTHIATTRGEVSVERLVPGDCVRTVSGAARTITWIGRRTVVCDRHPRPHDVWPVRIAAGAFDNGMPTRDLWLSPDHAVFVDGVLIPIRYFINGATVVQDAVEFVTYYHVELDHHDVLLAEGLPVESYLDTGNRGAFDNGGGAVQLHADFALKVWAADACAPLVIAGPVLEIQRTKMLARAAALGNRLSADPRLCLHADGQSLKLHRIGASMLAELPPGTREVRLLSRATVPAWTLPGSEDNRALGVAVTALRLDDADLADAAFGAGWHAREPGLRWTDGDAVLAVNGGGTLAIRLAPLLRYWVHPRRAAGVRKIRLLQ